MNPEIKALWLEALESGAYTQGYGALRTDKPREKFCCLGVLCDVLEPTGWQRNDIPRTYHHSGQSDSELPDHLADRAELTGSEEQDLIHINDGSTDDGDGNGCDENYQGVIQYIREKL